MKKLEFLKIRRNCFNFVEEHSCCLHPYEVVLNSQMCKSNKLEEFFRNLANVLYSLRQLSVQQLCKCYPLRMLSTVQLVKCTTLTLLPANSLVHVGDSTGKIWRRPEVDLRPG